MSSDDDNDTSPFVKSNDSPLTNSDQSTFGPNASSSVKQPRGVKGSPPCEAVIKSDPDPQPQDPFAAKSDSTTTGQAAEMGTGETSRHRAGTRADAEGRTSIQDTGFGLEDGREGEEWADPEHESKRVKVYELVGSRWVDQGTAFCFGQFQDDTNEAFLVARSETNYHNVILSTPIRTNDVYQQQAETLIVWTEPDGIDYALSFQDPDGCSEVWNFIQEVQQHLRGADTELALTSSSPINTNEELSVKASSIIRSGHLPHPQLGTIPEIEKAIKMLARTGPLRERICEYIQREEYIKLMVDVFTSAEDLESLDDLHSLCSLMQTILMLNDHSMYEHIMDDNLFFGVIGMLEYDPEFPNHKANYRDFLRNTSIFHQPIQIGAPIQRKVHHTYRLQFMKDVVLARTLDDSTFNVLNSCIIFNQVDIITHVQHDMSFLKQVVSLYVDGDILNGGRKQPGPAQPSDEGMEMDASVAEQPRNGVVQEPEKTGAYAFAPPDNLSEEELALRREVVLLIQHLCVMGKNVQLAARLALFRTLVDRGILFAVQWALGLPEKEETSKVMISNAGEILSALLDHDLIGVRGHVLKQVVAIEKERQAGKRGADKAETLLALLCRMMANSRDLAVQSQIGEALKALMDVPPPDDGTNTPQAANGVKFLARGGKDEPGTEKFLDYFYKHCIDILFKPFSNIPEAKNFSEPLFSLTRDNTNLYFYLCDLLCSFTLQHSFRSHFYLLCSNVATRVATLLKVRDKHLQLAAFRLFRIFLKLNNRNLFNHLMKHDLLKPILELTLQESRRDNLLSSSCQEFFDHMRRENYKDLIKHCMTKHEPMIRKLTETKLGCVRFLSFIGRWEMNNEPLPPEEVKVEKPPEPRGWPGQGRVMEAEEEDYFNADDDEDDGIIPSISSSLSRGTPPKALKRKRRIAISGGARNFRPPNVSTALRTPSPPLVSLVDYNEDEEDLDGLRSAEESSKETSGRANAHAGKTRSIEIPSSPTVQRPSIPPPPPPLGRRSLLDDDEDNQLEALMTRKPSPSPTPFVLGPGRPSEKRRRDEDEEDEPLARLSKAKKVESAPSSSQNQRLGLGVAGRTAAKNGDDPPKKLKLKFAGITPQTASSSSASPTSSQAGAKDGENG